MDRLLPFMGRKKKRLKGTAVPGLVFLLLCFLFPGIRGQWPFSLQAKPASETETPPDLYPDPYPDAYSMAPDFHTFPAQDQESARDFPVGQIVDFLRAWRSSGHEGYRFDPDYQERLDQILPRGLYRFGPRCPLVKLKDSDTFEGREIFHFQIQCLPEDLRGDFRISFVSESSPFPARFLREMESGREIYGGFFLMEKGVRERWYYTLWQTGPVRYANPFLEILHERHPEMTEPQFFTREFIAEALPEMLDTFESFQRAGIRSATPDFYAVVPPGSSISFTGKCPLRLASSPKREKGEERYLVLLRISCLKSHSRSGEIRFLLPPGNEALEFLEGVKPGRNFSGELIFRGIGGSAGQFHPEWDTIKNIRIPE